jgi:hypothetical protein
MLNYQRVCAVRIFYALGKSHQDSTIFPFRFLQTTVALPEAAMFFCPLHLFVETSNHG